MAKPQAAPKRGGRPARSNAEWWNHARVEAFEALRRGEKASVPERTLRGWQESPIWQARLAERDAAAAAAAQAVETAPLERLRSYLDGAVDAVGKMAIGNLDPCKTRLAAARDILDRLNVRAVADENQGITERFVRALCLDATLQRAQSLTLAAMREAVS